MQMVKSANMNGLLDSDSDSLTDCQQKVKARLHEIMQKEQDFTEEDFQKVCARAAGLLTLSEALQRLNSWHPSPHPTTAGTHLLPLAGQLHGVDPEPGENLRQGLRPHPEPYLADPQQVGGPQVCR